MPTLFWYPKCKYAFIPTIKSFTQSTQKGFPVLHTLLDCPRSLRPVVPTKHTSSEQCEPFDDIRVIARSRIPHDVGLDDRAQSASPPQPTFSGLSCGSFGRSPLGGGES